MTRAIVVGCGSIGTRHVRNLLSLDVEVTAVDPDPSASEGAAEEFGVPATTDLGEALEGNHDCALVCTPPSTHLAIAEELLDAGLHLFVEKPLSNDLAGTDDLIDLAERGGCMTLVGCNMRFHPPVRWIAHRFRSGGIGRLQFLRLRYGNYLPDWRPGNYEESYSAQADLGGGIVLDAIHELDVALEWLDDVDSLCCSAGEVGDLDLGVEDAAEILLRAPGPALAEVHLDYLRPERARTYELVGSDGLLRWHARGKDPERSELSYYDRVTETWEEEEYESDLNEMYVEEMEHFLDCIRGDAKPKLDLRGGRDVLALALAAKRSASTGTPQAVDP
jgi:predicted dehydrogenase